MRAAVFKAIPWARNENVSVQEPTEARRGPWGEGMTAAEMEKCRWVKPRLVATIDYLERTVANNLRHPMFVGLTKKSAVIITTNLPFSEWTQVIPYARLCKALIDRITDRAPIIETGAESYRFRRTLEKREGRTAMANMTSAAPQAAEKKGS